MAFPPSNNNPSTPKKNPFRFSLWWMYAIILLLLGGILYFDTNTVTKCTLCNHLTQNSDGVENEDDTYDVDHCVPPCVHNCCNGARFFGDLDDEKSPAAKAVAQAQSQGRAVHYLEADGAQPVACYILSQDVAWQGLDNSCVLYAKG